ncbi:MAG: hypothetical protein ACOCT9_02780 [archaeon]
MTDDYDPHISCEEYEEDNDVVGYSKKIIKFDSRGYSDLISPFKVVNMEALSKETKSLYKSLSSPIIFESPKFVWHPQTYNAIEEVNEGYINNTSKLLSILGMKPSLCDEINNSLTVSSVAFHRNPFDERVSKSSGKTYDPLDKNNFETFLQNLYSYSQGIVLVPDINITRISGEGYSIDTEEYLENIDFFTKILSDRNNKPIFVPIQTNLTKKSAQKILNHYKKKGYTNLWINFRGGEVTGRNLAGLRLILKELDRKYTPEEYCLYCSHLKKEISPHFHDVKTASSDILSQFGGGDIIGANREFDFVPGDFNKDKHIKKLGLSDEEEYEEKKKLHKRRLFDPNSYYYYIPTDHPEVINYPYSPEEVINDETKNESVDNLIKFKEIEKLKRIFEEEGTVKKYLKRKSMFDEEKEISNEILNYSTSNYEETNLFDF